MMSFDQTPIPQPIPDTCYPGVALEGRIVHITTFGAFLELESGVIGLLHLSQMKGFPERVEMPEMGTKLRVKIIAIDAERGAVALSPEP
jgi:predicted RNA-binding protein with RPS1 domain